MWYNRFNFVPGALIWSEYREEKWEGDRLLADQQNVEHQTAKLETFIGVEVEQQTDPFP
jgi:hypothetical protein